VRRPSQRELIIIMQRILTTLVLGTAFAACSKGSSKAPEAEPKPTAPAPTAPAPTAPTPTAPAPTAPTPTAPPPAAAPAPLTKLDLAAPELDAAAAGQLGELLGGEVAAIAQHRIAVDGDLGVERGQLLGQRRGLGGVIGDARVGVGARGGDGGGPLAQPVGEVLGRGDRGVAQERVGRHRRHSLEPGPQRGDPGVDRLAGAVDARLEIEQRRGLRGGAAQRAGGVALARRQHQILVALGRQRPHAADQRRGQLGAQVDALPGVAGGVDVGGVVAGDGDTGVLRRQPRRA
jgi:hypothetical protein